MKRSRKSPAIAKKEAPLPSYLQASHGSDDLSQYGEATDVVKWVAAMRGLTTSIPAIPLVPEIPGAADEQSSPEKIPRLLDDCGAVSIAPFASMIPSSRSHPDATRKTVFPNSALSLLHEDPSLIPVPDRLDAASKQSLAAAKMKMIQISKLPFEMQDAIFELGTSMLIYAINMEKWDAKKCRYRDRRSFGPLQETFSSTDEVLREIANSCPLAYTCRRPRAAVFRMLNRLMQPLAENIEHPKEGISILKDIHVTVRIGNLVAKKQMNCESENPSERQCYDPKGECSERIRLCQCPKCHGGITGGLRRIAGLRSQWLYDNPFVSVTDLEKRCAKLPSYLLQYVDRIDAEWWFNRNRRCDNAQSPSDVLKESAEMFHRARHITITPCLPLMSTGQLRDLVKEGHHLRRPWIEPEEIAIAKLRQWKRYRGVLEALREVQKLDRRTAFNSRSQLKMYVTESFPLPIFELISTKKRAR